MAEPFIPEWEQQQEFVPEWDKPPVSATSAREAALESWRDVGRKVVSTAKAAPGVIADIGLPGAGQVAGEYLGAKTGPFAPVAAPVFGGIGAGVGSVASDVVNRRPIDWKSARNQAIIGAAAGPATKLLMKTPGLRNLVAIARTPKEQAVAVEKARELPSLIGSQADKGRALALQRVIDRTKATFELPETKKAVDSLLAEPGITEFLHTDKGTVIAGKLKKILDMRSAAPQVSVSAAPVVNPQTGKMAVSAATPTRAVSQIVPPGISPAEARKIMLSLNEFDRETTNAISKAHLDRLKSALMSDWASGHPVSYRQADTMFALWSKLYAAKHMEDIMREATSPKYVTGLERRMYPVESYPPRTSEVILREMADPEGQFERFIHYYPNEAAKIKDTVTKLGQVRQLFAADVVSPYEQRHLIKGAQALSGTGAHSIPGAMEAQALAVMPHAAQSVVARALVTPGGRKALERLLQAGPITRGGLVALTNLNKRLLGPDNEFPELNQ